VRCVGTPICARCKKKDLVCQFSQTKKRGPKGKQRTLSNNLEMPTFVLESVAEAEKNPMRSAVNSSSGLYNTLVEYLRVAENVSLGLLEMSSVVVYHPLTLSMTGERNPYVW